MGRGREGKEGEEEEEEEVMAGRVLIQGENRGRDVWGEACRAVLGGGNKGENDKNIGTRKE